MAEQRRRSADELADEWQRRADRTREAARTEQATEEHLNALLPDLGFYCLHDCHWPGTRAANIDHVVIGPTGAWVIDDKRLSQRVSRGKDGSLWNGRYPMRNQIAKATEQARAVANALGVDQVEAVLSIEAPAVPEPAFTISGVHIARALWPTAQLVRDASPILDARDVSALASRAIATLAPRLTARPTAHTVDTGSVPDLPPDFAALPPARRERSVTHRTPRKARPTVRARRRTSSRQRRKRNAIGELVAIAVTIVMLLAITNALLDVARSKSVAMTTPSEPTVEHSCPSPGAGWTATVRFSGATPNAWWGPALEGPWELLQVTGAEARRAGLSPSQRSIFRIERSRPDGTTYEDTAVADAPAQAC